MSGGCERYDIITIHMSCDASTMTRLLEAAVDVVMDKYPKDEGWTGPWCESKDHCLRVFVCRDDLSRAKQAPAIGVDEP